MAELTKPAAIHWVDGSQEENDDLARRWSNRGTFIKLNQNLWPGCYYARSDASDVARVEDRTFICSLSKDNAGPTNNWVNPFEMRASSRSCSTAACAGAPCTCCRSAWGRSARPCRRSACSSPIRRMWWSTCASWRASGSPYLRGNRQGLQARGAVHAHRRRAARARRARRALALQPGKVHRAFPGNARDLVLRFRLRRQCAAGQKMLRAAHRLQHRARRRLDGGAHADPRRGGSQGRKDLCRRGLPQRLRQNQFRHADSARRLRRLEGLDRRRRHRLDQAGRERAPARDQSGSRILRRRARAPRSRPIPTPWPRWRGTPFSPTSR